METNIDWEALKAKSLEKAAAGVSSHTAAATPPKARFQLERRAPRKVIHSVQPMVGAEHIPTHRPRRRRSSRRGGQGRSIEQSGKRINRWTDWMVRAGLKNFTSIPMVNQTTIFIKGLESDKYAVAAALLASLLYRRYSNVYKPVPLDFGEDSNEEADGTDVDEESMQPAEVSLPERGQDVDEPDHSADDPEKSVKKSATTAEESTTARKTRNRMHIDINKAHEFTPELLGPRTPSRPVDVMQHIPEEEDEDIQLTELPELPELSELPEFPDTPAGLKAPEVQVAEASPQPPIAEENDSSNPATKKTSSGRPISNARNSEVGDAFPFPTAEEPNVSTPPKPRRMSTSSGAVPLAQASRTDSLTLLRPSARRSVKSQPLLYSSQRTEAQGAMYNNLARSAEDSFRAVTHRSK